MLFLQMAEALSFALILLLSPAPVMAGSRITRRLAKGYVEISDSVGEFAGSVHEMAHPRAR